MSLASTAPEAQENPLDAQGKLIAETGWRLPPMRRPGPPVEERLSGLDYRGAWDEDLNQG
jgi:hypothetical protein